MKRADLQQFCAAEDDLRCYICLPWSRGEWTYATNGHILVRVARLADVDENEKAPNAEKLIADQPPAKDWLPVPVCKMPKDKNCMHCSGTGKIGMGRGYKKEDCVRCDTGKVKNLDGMDVGKANFALRYLAIIQGWEIAPNGPKGAAWIRNDEATGLLMPRNK